MLEGIQKLAPWITNLPTVPKITMTVVVVLLCFVLLYVVWVPPPTKNPANETSVKEAYARMQRVLSRLGGSGDQVTVDGDPVAPRSLDLYKPYLAIANTFLLIRITLKAHTKRFGNMEARAECSVPIQKLLRQSCPDLSESGTM
jgi:hypothetical protein